MNRSHLTPAPITDKNGVTSTRWVKPEQAPDAAARQIPAPGITPAKERAPHADDNHLREVIYGDEIFDISRQNLSKIFGLIRDDDPTVIPFVYTLLTTGSQLGSDGARATFRDSLSGIAGAMHSADEDENWMDLCSWGDDIKSSIMRSWSAGNVIEEAVPDVDQREISRIVNGVYMIDGHRIRSSDNPYDYSPMNTEFWRGMTALHMSDNMMKTRLPKAFTKDAYDFIDWAGHHKNIALVIQTAKERGTLNVEHLRYIVDNENVESALREGIL